MKEDVSRILKMMEEGKIDSDKAAELISAIKEREKEEPSTITLNKVSNLEKMLKIKVRSIKGDNVDIKLPIKFVKAILSATGRIPGISMNGTEGMDIHMDMIADAIENGIDGKIVDIKSANGDIVEIAIE
ncbi:hypothetical protein GOM49_16185 [Clostridium bovifaecis]|uniref:YvlB/LiaX N-terminal domain-containing protein n=1 Tax=Clostridium bovifaecis TaxID=2184719 RepID=A0A6I6EVW2_9CLOT|nr:hypothetical protein GOM49_16185 [Clostridium bovifaecis]